MPKGHFNPTSKHSHRVRHHTPRAPSSMLGRGGSISVYREITLHKTSRVISWGSPKIGGVGGDDSGVYKCTNAGTGRAGKKLGMSGRKLDERETRGVGSFVSPEVQHIVHLIYLI